MKVLVTGAAGFIGAAVTKKLIQEGEEVVGIDNLNNFYDVQLKKDRLADIGEHSNFIFTRLDISNREQMESFFKDTKPERVIHLAAQAGVRYSLKNPYSYINSNLLGFLNILEGCRHNNVEHLVYASSSSVYGANTKMPFSVHDNVDHPLSLYGATKKANELMAHSYSSLYNLSVTGLRFFTVYGPWGRPDMSLFIFTRKILAGEPIDIFNEGNHKRDFTYISDAVESIVRVFRKQALPNSEWDGDNPDPATSSASYRLYNIGCHNPVNLMHAIELLESSLDRKAVKNFLPIQPGDVPDTYADVEDLMQSIDYKPTIKIETGIRDFVAWYKQYYGVE